MKQMKISGALAALGAAGAIASLQKAHQSGKTEIMKDAFDGLSAQSMMTADAFQNLAAAMTLKPDFRAERSGKFNRFKMERGVASLHRDIKCQAAYLKRRNKAGRPTPAVFGFPVARA
jgi:hypothetical protein